MNLQIMRNLGHSLPFSHLLRVLLDTVLFYVPEA